VGKYGEDCKIAVRNVRKDVIKKITGYGDAFAKVSWWRPLLALPLLFSR